MRGEEACAMQLDMMRACIYEAGDKIAKAGKDAINSFAEGDEQRMMLMGLRRFTKVDPINIKESYRRIAGKMIEENKYCF
jgi:hypothetical protein